MTLMYAYEYNTEHKFISYLSYIDHALQSRLRKRDDQAVFSASRHLTGSNINDICDITIR